VKALGIPGVLGIGIAVFCLVFYATAIVPAERELRAKRSAAAGASAPRQLVPVSHAVNDLYARFPPLEALSNQVAHLHRLGRTSGLQLQQGDYRLEAPPAGLIAYRVSLPVRGDYAALRRFMGAVLQEIPVASIDRLRFERKKPGDTQLDAHLQLTLFFRPESP
jgi:hypothetical protein